MLQFPINTVFYVPGNKSDRLEFNTLSGILVARKGADSGSITLDFPANEPTSLVTEDQAQFGGLVKHVEDKFVLEDVKVSKTAKKILIRLADDTSRSASIIVYCVHLKTEQSKFRENASNIISK